METQREKYFISNTMVCLLKALEGQETTVELRGEREVIGTVLHVDGYMNISMKCVRFKSLTQTRKFDDFFVNGKNIRYVHIPDEINMKQAMEGVLKQYCSRSANMRVNQEIKDKAWQKLKKKENIAKRNLLREEREQSKQNKN